MFAGLPELGIANGEDLKETLTNCTEPLKAIDQFQVTTTAQLVLRYVSGSFQRKSWKVMNFQKSINCFDQMLW